MIDRKLLEEYFGSFKGSAIRLQETKGSKKVLKQFRKKINAGEK